MTASKVTGHKRKAHQHVMDLHDVTVGSCKLAKELARSKILNAALQVQLAASEALCRAALDEKASAGQRIFELETRVTVLHDEHEVALQRLKQYDASFRQELTCSICLSIMVGAVSLSTCSHKFCADCAKQALRTSQSCPQCRLPAQPRDVKPDCVIRNLVAKLKQP